MNITTRTPEHSSGSPARGIGRGTRQALATLALTTALLTAAGCTADASGDQDAPVTMNVLSFSGHLNDVNQEAAAGFEKKYNVTINWIQGDPANNVAKVLSGKSHQTYDIAFADFKTQYVASGQGAWEKLDPSIVTNLTAIDPVGITPSGDGLGYGTYPVGIYYNIDKFADEGWPAPTSYQDLIDPRYCNVTGLSEINELNGVFAILGLGSTATNPGDTDLDGLFQHGLTKLTSAKACFPNFESNSAGMDQKAETDQYYIGIAGLNRTLPLQDKGKNLGFVVPKEGAFYTTSTMSIAVNAPHPKLAQELVNWFASADAQKIQMTDAYYVPTNTSVTIPVDLEKRGVVGGGALATLVRPFDLTEAQKLQPTWVDQWNAAFSS
ncbi:extracellular solute-binding protein [Galbitalea sp. SE-J8]|uniref:ABC transporter substrate-binding protein n=1 Tax=Galbitalea sp. SE-J8 TaxID=3054952 RepID=UPI00259C87C1|nr:extracellular solute-binding protein [Galbitalea sp. SE-J8]MDM4763000.1 extracellular solute-binding protein [Galbitalea sp. SE-J8]